MPSFQGALIGSVAAAALKVTVGDHTVDNIASIEPADGAAGIKALRDGNIQTGIDATGTSPSYSNVGGGEWASPANSTVGDDYEVRMVTVSGTVSVGTVDTWLALTSDREWKVTQTVVGSKTFTGTLEIRRVGGSILDSGSITLTATVTII